MLHRYFCPQCHHSTELELDPSLESASMRCEKCGAQGLVRGNADGHPDPPFSSRHESAAILGRVLEPSPEGNGEGSPSAGPKPPAILGRLVERSRMTEGGFWSALMGRIPAGSPDPNLVFTGVLALLITLLLMLVLLRPIQSTGVGARLYDRGWVPYVIIGFSVWAFTILAMKLRSLLAQRRWLSHLAAVGIPEIRQRDTGQVRTMIRKAGVNPGSFAANRILVGLDHFEARGDASEVSAMLSAQAANDEARIEASYLMLRVLIWAVPIVGFIGTVIGIGAAVQGFAETLGHAQEFEVIKGSLTKVTGGLAVAFDTTLVALMMSVFIMFPTHALQKAEMLLLTATERFLATNFVGRLRRLSGASSDHEAGAEGPNGREVPERFMVLLEEIRTYLRGNAEMSSQLLQASLLGRSSLEEDDREPSTDGEQTPSADAPARQPDRGPDQG